MYNVDVNKEMIKMEKDNEFTEVKIKE